MLLQDWPQPYALAACSVCWSTAVTLDKHLHPCWHAHGCSPPVPPISHHTFPGTRTHNLQPMLRMVAPQVVGRLSELLPPL